MEKFITKTSVQAKQEQQERDKESSCPECGKIAHIGINATRSLGRFGLKTEYRKEYTCFQCGCEWNTGWKN